VKEAPVASALEELCLACGFCCDGTLFAHAPLKSDEVAPLQALGVRLVVRRDKSVSIQQGCSALSGRCCQVYAARPGTCRKFVCTLGAALENGEVGLPEALETVGQAHGLLAQLGATLPPPSPGDTSSPLMRARSGAQQDTLEITAERRAAWDRAEDFVLAAFIRPRG
jgi:uncharacterized protein